VDLRYESTVVLVLIPNFGGCRSPIFLFAYEFLAVDALSALAPFRVNEPNDLQLSDLPPTATLQQPASNALEL
jgi:hypothetical protein